MNIFELTELQSAATRAYLPAKALEGTIPGNAKRKEYDEKLAEFERAKAEYAVELREIEERRAA